MIKKRIEIPNHQAELALFSRRTAASFFMILLMTAALLVNLYHLQVSGYQRYSGRANNNRIKIVPIAPNRGLIYDRNGVLLAKNVPIYSLEIIPEKIKDIESTLIKLKNLLGLSDNDIIEFKQSMKQTRHFKSVTFTAQLTEKQVAMFTVHQHQFPGVFVDAFLERYYPYKENLTHILGYVAKINDRDINRLKQQHKYKQYKATRTIGKLGIERSYEEILHGQSGFAKVEVNSQGRVIRTLETVPPIPGKDIKLNIDINLQLYANKLLTEKKIDPATGKSILKHKRGALVVLDPRDDSILAMVSSPSYDPNWFVHGISSARYKALLSDPDKPLFNRVTLGAYSPGSTAKPMIAAAALTEGVITPGTTRNDSGWWRIPNTKSRKWRDDVRGGFGEVNIYKAIEKSVNTYFYPIAFDMGIDRLSVWMNKFGYGLPSGIDIKEDSRANMPTREWKRVHYHQSWYQGDTIPIGIGQGYWTATPLQIAKATSVIANKGLVHRPHIVRSIVENDVETDVAFNDFSKMGSVKQETWNIVQEGMRRVLVTGTGRQAFSHISYDAAGKSGTSQVFGLDHGENYNAEELTERLRDHALFTAFAPLKSPKVLVTAVLENGGWGRRAAPMVRKIMDYVLIKPTLDPQSTLGHKAS
ncbi:penicillin-binding protein 2 [Moritella sp. 36]|uniref:penicillin-binding protein 2 n=1 Tax=Moritella sp. 36 TaxID=2746233 RepID=UPI001BEEFCA6|nr:penicillin-binding protein 2 [Moritella sp. 36]QUM87690.1 penicillin-binding protein 2 [Moritella sp. 36]